MAPRPLDTVEMRWRMIEHRLRQEVRGRHSRQASAELNELLPRERAKFDAAVNRGELPEVGDYFGIGA